MILVNAFVNGCPFLKLDRGNMVVGQARRQKSSVLIKNKEIIVVLETTVCGQVNAKNVNQFHIYMDEQYQEYLSFMVQ